MIQTSTNFAIYSTAKIKQNLYNRSCFGFTIMNLKEKIMNKKFIWSIAGFVLALLVYLYASPYIAINSIKNAAQAGDSGKLSKYIDYPSVRQSFKDQMNAMMVKEMANQENNEWAALGAMLASTMVDKMIDGIVTPEGMALMLQGKNLKDGLPQSTHTSQSETKEVFGADYTRRYTGFNNFEIMIKDKERAQSVKIHMVRDGLRWKISKIAMPLE